MMRKIYLPNTEFIFNLGDWPLAKSDGSPVPIVSWCGSRDTVDIVLPTYELTRSVIESMESTTIDIHTAKGEKHYRWPEKKDTAIFRGRDSNKIRLEVANLSRFYPDVLDAGITRYFFSNQSQHTPTVKVISFPDFFEHKFILSIDGTVASYRFPFLLAGDSVIFKSVSNFYEHYYADLEEGLHYFHFNSDLVKQIKMARKRDYNMVIITNSLRLN
ncbi:unnamed protein product [Gongylonema pulchrum]|uniref:Glycosyl transferase CAP10 domain-containing protein n=1 Tax=Gongylonema pulchrum TaxID=637853 RepID=A0A3P6PWP7_9BILA|nr:unnamed protein product [Gongylonema pulchrum]